MPCQSGQLHCILLLDLGPTFVSALDRKIGATPSLALVDRLEERDGITASYWRGLLRTFEEEKPVETCRILDEGLNCKYRVGLL